MSATQKGEGFNGLGLPPLPLTTAVDTDQILSQVAENVQLTLPRLSRFRAHQRSLSVAGGGPSLGKTKDKLEGVTVAVNASLSYLVDEGIKPWACGICDPGEHIPDLIENVPGVFYFVASTCHPKLFEKLADRDVIMWHPSGTPGIDEIILPRGEMLVGGGSTMGLRWLNVGYMLGFRSFDFHGLDSSFAGEKTHAYPDRRDGGEFMEFEGFSTSVAFLRQVADFFEMVERYQQPDIEPTRIKVYGDGLLQRKCPPELLAEPGERGSPDTRDEGKAGKPGLL